MVDCQQLCNLKLHYWSFPRGVYIALFGGQGPGTDSKKFENLETVTTWTVPITRRAPRTHQRLKMSVKSDNFSKGIVLRFNLGPLHLLDGFIDEIWRLKQQNLIWENKSKLVELLLMIYVNKSAAMGSFQKKNEEKSQFLTSFWLKQAKNQVFKYMAEAMWYEKRVCLILTGLKLYIVPNRKE